MKNVFLNMKEISTKQYLKFSFRKKYHCIEIPLYKLKKC